MPIIKVKVKPNSKEYKVEWQGDLLRVWLKEKPEKGKANRELIRVLSNYFSIPASRIRILKGLKSKEKIIEIS